MPQLEQVEFFISQLFWLGVFFVVLFSVLTYITLPKIRAFLNKRDDFVKSHISKQDDLIKKAESIIENYETKLNEAKNEASKIISDANPFGINLDDPNGKDDIIIESEELHLAKDRPVKILLRSIDVLHNYYVPQFRAKMDAVPGIVSFYWFEPNKNGEYEVLCAEYCGVGHYAMRGLVIVEDEEDYKKWLAEHETFSSFIAKQKSNPINNKQLAKINNLLNDK